MAVTKGLRRQATGAFVDIAIIGGVVLIGLYAAKKTNLGSFITTSLQGAGATTGSALLAPFTGLLQGFTTQGAQLAQAAGGLGAGALSSGADLQRFLTGGKTFGELFNGQGPASSTSTAGQSAGLQSQNPGSETAPATSQSSAKIVPLASVQNFVTQSRQGTITSTSANTALFQNDFTTQPLSPGAGLTTSGAVRTGRTGLSDYVLAQQQKLSAKTGIPTFDVAGNLSTIAGAATTATRGSR